MQLPSLDAQRIFLILHLLGMAIGVGGAVVTDVFFMKFLRDFKISKLEADFLRTLSRIMWSAVVILALSGLGLFLLDVPKYSASPKFLAKMTVVLVLVINGSFLHFVVTPTLRKLAFHPPTSPKADRPRMLRQRAFVAGAISIASWAYAFLLAMLKWTDVPYLAYIAAYGILLVFAFAGALLMDAVLMRKARHSA